MKKTTLYIAEELLDEIKIAGVRRKKRSVTDVIDEALRLWLNPSALPTPAVEQAPAGGDRYPDTETHDLLEELLRYASPDDIVSIRGSLNLLVAGIKRRNRTKEHRPGGKARRTRNAE